MATTKWNVQSVHCSVAVGDCAFHILVKVTNNVTTVEKIILIDGGTHSTTNAILEPMMTKIKEQFSMKEFKIDTIIVSHWDEDHWGALLAKLRKDLLLAVKKKKKPSEVLTYLRWDSDDEPDSYLYCPNEEPAGSKGVKAGTVNGLPDGFRRGTGANADYLEICTKSKKADADEDDWFPVAVLRSAQISGLYRVLGVDFFQRTFLTTKPGTDYKPAKLVSDNAPEVVGQPGMYCIGVMNTTFGGTLPAIDEAIDDVGVPEIVREGVTKTNQWSIATVILWPNQDDKTLPPRCSHYFAGDADELREAEYQKWLRDGGIATMTNMKLSHHGSRSSSPIDAIGFAPLNIVISNPDGKYFHPGWETILFFAAWLRYGREKEARAMVPRAWSIKYPFYFLMDTNSQFLFADPKETMFNTKAFDEVKHGKVLQDYLKAVAKECVGWDHNGTAGLTEMDVYNAAVAKGDQKAARATLLGLIQARWTSFFKPLADDFPLATVKNKKSKSSVTTVLQGIVVMSASSFDNGDGQLRFFREDRTKPVIRRRSRRTVAVASSTNNKKRMREETLNVPGFMTNPAKKFKKALRLQNKVRHPKILAGGNDDPMDEDLGDPAIVDEFSFYTQSGTNINEMDHPDWDPEELDDESIERALQTLRPSGTATLPWIPRDGSPDSWYIYASSIAETAIQAVTNRFTQTTSVQDWDYLLSTLHCAMITLTRDPMIVDPESKTIDLDPEDEVFTWFKDALYATNAAMIKNPSLAAGSIIGGFIVATRILPLDTNLFAANPVSLLFSTEAAVLSDVFDGSTPPEMGLREGETAVVLGLDARLREPENVTLFDLAKFAGLEAIFENPFLSALQILNFELPHKTKTGTGKRNALWFVPQDSYATYFRLQLDLASDQKDILQSFLGMLQGTVKQAYVIARRKSVWTSNSTDITFDTDGSISIVIAMEVAGLNFEVYLDLDEDTMEITLNLKEKTGKVLDKMLNYLKTTILGETLKSRAADEDPFPFTEWLTQSAGSISFPSFDFRRVRIVYSPKAADPSSLEFSSLALDLEVAMEVKDQLVLCLMTFTYSGAGGPGLSLKADLWFAPPYDYDNPQLRLLPDFEDYEWFEPLNIDMKIPFKEWPTFLELRKLAGFNPEDSPPSIFPTAITAATFFISKEKIKIDGTLRSLASQDHSKPPIFSIDQIDLSASYDFNVSTFNIETEIRSLIQPPPTTDLNKAEIRAAFAYNGDEKQWRINGSVANLTAAHFYQFFQPEVRAASTSLLESIAVKEFDVEYVYTGGQASQLTISGLLGIGSLIFNVEYNNRGDAWSWDFFANVKFDKKKKQTSLFSDMLSNVVGDGGIELPGFLANIKVTMAETEDEIGVRLVPDKERKCIVFTMWVKFGPLRIQYIQFAYSNERMAKAGTPPIKRVFLTSIDALPKIDVPLVGNITQPFDEALALWVQPQDGWKGLTLDDVELINTVITAQPLNQKALPYKAVMKEPTKEDVVLRSGVHLMLVLKDDKGKTNVALDYVFMDKKPDLSKSLTNVIVNEDTTDDNKESGMAEYSKDKDGLSVRNLGLKYSGNKLSIKVDAEVKFGPIDFALYGFSIHMQFTPGEDFSLFNLPVPTFSLEGLSASYQKAPITLGGMLLHISNDEMDLYQGGLVAGYTPWLLSAAGCYGEIKGMDAYKTFFVYARLLGPLITFEFATITGVTAGFGYNNTMRYPTVKDIITFPLLSVPTPPSNDAKGAIQALVKSNWFGPRKDSFWIAAGLTVTAFEILEVSAVIAVEWDPNVKIGLFAIGTLDVPKGPVKFAHVQLGLTAVIDIGAGTLKIDGELTPSSYVLHPDCHLTGGFGLYSWFGDSVPELKGDFVFTIGGYHRQFKPPSQYPHPPRLGISWKFNDNISITGEAYFAITTKVCMGGGRWSVSLSLGPLQAYYNSFIDFLISFKPFCFFADGGISVGVKFTMDLWFVTIRISVDIGASIHIAGPPIHGMVHVDFWVFGFDIYWGNGGGNCGSLTLEEFITLACQSAGSNGVDMLETITADTVIGKKPKPTESLQVADDPRKPHVLVVQTGLIPNENITSTPSGGLWNVRAANFSFAVSCKCAITKATIITGSVTKDDDEVEPEYVVEGPKNPIFAKPMCDTNVITTELTVRISPDAPSQGLLTFDDGLAESEPVWSNNTGIVKSLPTGLWGKYIPSEDPRSAANSKNMLNGTTGGTVSLLAGVVITVPKPAVSELDTLPAFDFRKFMVLAITEFFAFPALPENDARWAPAKPVVSEEEEDDDDDDDDDEEDDEEDDDDSDDDDDTYAPKDPAHSALAGTGEQWAAVRAQWDNPGFGTEAPLQTVELWAQVGRAEFGWDEKKVNDGTNGMTGRRPAELVNGLEGYYLWAPFLSAAA